MCVYHWISGTLTGKARVHTKAASEMLIRRWLSTLKELVKEYVLTVDVTLVLSTQNIADQLTQVPQRWFEAMKKENEPKLLIGTAHIDELDASQIMAIHRGSGHPRVRRTTHFVRRICPTVAKAAVRSAIRMCEECQSIDSALIQWEKGKLEVNRNWQRLGMDITHYITRHFLTFMDCSPLRFSIWKQLVRQDSASVIRQLEAVFFKRSPPHKILTDNDTAFHSKEFKAFTHEWGIHLRFRCAYAPTGNGIAERCHCMVKWIAARMHCPIQEAVYWYNITPRDDVSPSTVPANRIYCYEVGVKGANHASSTALTKSETACGSKRCRVDVWRSSARVRWPK